MSDIRKKLLFMKMTCWLGILADALWAIGLFFPALYGFLVGISGFEPNIQMRLTMGIGGSLMAGWTLLLLWTLVRPIERKVVFLLTAFPVLTGLIAVVLVDFLRGNTYVTWILIKSLALIILMIVSYAFACSLEKETP